ncbi:MAG: GNAT family N-acetyltransferase [Chloroflexi bacterium]|nr:GNAT family N-acetyltransferase [Chloroflexota bacterium]
MNTLLLNNLFPIQEYKRDGFVISTDPTRFDLDVIHAFLANEAYWSPDVPRETVARQMRHALCFGLYSGEAQAGFARVITDFTTFAYLADVFVLRPYRGRGLGKWLTLTILAHPELQGLRKWTLNTQDAHGLYQKFGFKNDPQPENYLLFRPNG